MTATTRELRGVDVPEPGTFTIDPAHTTVGFVARHLMVTKVRGRFADVTGSVVVAVDPLASTAEATIATATLTTGSADRDAHLRSADFFDVDSYPSIRFVSTKVERKGVERKGDRFAVTGELSIRDVTKPVVLDVELDGVATDPWGSERLALTATTEVDREEWGLTWNVALESGGVLVSRRVLLEIEAQAVRQA